MPRGCCCSKGVGPSYLSVIIINISQKYRFSWPIPVILVLFSARGQGIGSRNSGVDSLLFAAFRPIARTPGLSLIPRLCSQSLRPVADSGHRQMPVCSWRSLSNPYLDHFATKMIEVGGEITPKPPI